MKLPVWPRTGESSDEMHVLIGIGAAKTDLSKQFYWPGDFYEGLSLRQSQLCLLNHLQPQRIRIGIEYCRGVCRKNEPRAQLHLVPQLITRPSGISQVNVKNVRVRPGRNCFFEEAFVGDQINT